MSSSGKDLAEGQASGVSPSREIDAFLAKAKHSAVAPRGDRGRLIFAMDATLSRQPAWDIAQAVQGRMFEAAAADGGLDVQLVYFRGLMECRASPFVANGEGLARLMSKIDCRGGETQIRKVLTHVRDEAKAARVGAFVYVGDAMEENGDRLCAMAGEIALLGVRAFMFQEGDDPAAERTFREIARLTGGAYAVFDAMSPHRLAGLMASAAAYASGGKQRLEREALAGAPGAQLLLSQVR